MRTRLLIVGSLLGTILLVPGCKPKNGDCDTTDDCKEQDDYKNDVCVNKHCQECGADSDCKAGFTCQANKCTPKPECASSADCGSGRICQDQKCVPGCTKDADCSGGKCVSGQCKAAGTCTTDGDCTGGQTCQAGYCSAPQQAAACQLQRVNFDFNESKLTSSGEATLQEDAQCIKTRNIGHVTLEGNADERGTEEYNLHLGERRAESAKKYLEKLGVEGRKLKTISYGKERPVNPGHDEAAWAENRRTDVVEK
jgi:peptidoglycan-associated lipoprotein